MKCFNIPIGVSAWTALVLSSALLGSAHAAATGSVCLYNKINYGGKPFCTDADAPRLAKAWRGKISSVKVASGKTVQLFDKTRYAGTSISLSADTPDLSVQGFDDRAASLRFAQAANPPIVGGYYPNWTPSPPRIRDLNPNYNLVYLFAAHPVGGPPGTTGAVTFDAPGDGRGAATNLNADIQYARSIQGRKILLSVGGAGQGMSFPTRAKSQAFVDSIVAIYNQLGGFDGLDWNTFEGSQAPDTSEMIWISLQLKAKFPGFIVSAPPAPWNSVDKTFCQAMVAAGALDYAAPQYYDGPNLADPAYVVPNVNEWVALLGASHVVVGFGINNATNYMTPAQAVTTWNQVKANNPSIRGGFDWNTGTDEDQGWPFANQVAPLILH